MWVLCLFRVLAGFGLGGAVPLDFSLFAEFLPTRNRGRWLVTLESFWGVGTVVAAALAWLLVPTLGWRWLLATSAIAGALVFWVRLRVPESPRYLAATGRVDEAEAVLGQVARENGVPERDVPRIAPPADASDKVQIRRLFEGRLARTTVMLWSTWFFIALAYYGLFSWMPKILAEPRPGRRPDLQLRAAARRGAAARVLLGRLARRALGPQADLRHLPVDQRRCARSCTAAPRTSRCCWWPRCS